MLTKYLVKRMRTGDGAPDANLTYPPGYDEKKHEITIGCDFEYPSQYYNNFYDIYYPVGCMERCPTILWIHGGSFVAGTRYGIANVATMLALEGYTVIAAEYALAPEAKHPIPVRQMQELYLHLCEKNHPQVDIQNIFIAGDSAGALIAAQFAAVQTNAELAQAMNIKPVIPAGTLRGAILTCGPYDLAGIRKADSKLLRIGLWFLGRALFEGRPWHKSDDCKHSTVADHVTGDYPPTYITDGNEGSFEVQGRRLAMALRGKSVPVAERFFEAAQGEVPHEYLFQLADKKAQICLDEIIHFIETYKRRLLQ